MSAPLPTRLTTQEQREIERFKQAYQSGEITRAQYEQALSVYGVQPEPVTSPLPTPGQSYVKGNWIPVTPEVQSQIKQAQKESQKKTTTPTPLPVSGKSFVQGNWIPVTPETVKTLTPEQQQNLQASLQKAEAIQFYSEMGKPELAEKYAAPTLPSDVKAVSVEEVTLSRPPLTVQEALHPSYVVVTTAPKEEPPKSIGEQIASVSPTDIGLWLSEQITGKQLTRKQEAKARELLKPISDFSGIPGIKGTPTEFIGGLVTAFETPVYTAAKAFGVKGVPEPKITGTGALVTSGIESITKGTLTASEAQKELEKESPAYIAGTFAGDIALLGIGTKGAEKIFQVTAKALPVLAQPGLVGMGARAGFAGLGGAAVSGVLSGGDPEAILYGATLAAGASVGVELGLKTLSYVRGKLPPRIGGYRRLVEGPEAIGKSGEPVKTYVSDSPLDELGGRRLEVVADVTKNPVGYHYSLNDMVDDYVNQALPTGHATLSPESFNLSVGGKTVLKGIPSESAGFRASKELFHFYSAPGDDELVTIYGGYVGVGRGYSETPKIVFGGKPTALVTTKTVVSPEFLRQAGESLDDYLARVSLISGKTGIAPETLIGASVERQLITPAQYERLGVKLPGSMFVSEGKVGTFQVVQKPEGIAGKIPIVKDLLADYTNITVYKGSFAPTTEADALAKTLNVQSYGASYGKTVSLPSLTGSPSTLPLIVYSKPSTSKASSSVTSTLREIEKSVASQSQSSIPSMPSLPSVPSMPSFPSEPPSSPPSEPPSYPPSKPPYSPPSSPPISPPSFPSDFLPKPPKDFPAKFKLTKYGRTPRAYPIKTAKEMEKELFGKRRRSKRGKKG